ncbi:MAG TPA: diaminopimelate decarboxylase, partial [Armatimonadota bacterium]|nr:diaminopimelate decarboxylase [Armatimonadota bacterium]
MMLLGTQRVNEIGHLEIGGCDTVDLAEQFGTPLYVMDEVYIRENCKRYLTAFRALYPEVEIAFAGKSFMTAAMCKIVNQEKLYLDVASGGEIYTAKIAGYPMEKIIFHGSNKSIEELQMSLDLGVGRVVVDNFLELTRLNELAKASGKKAGILLRLTPGIDPHTHKLIRTGQEDTKFGFNIKDGAAMDAVRKALECSNINLIGLHCHVGSQLLDTTAHEQAIKVMVRFISDAQKIGYKASELNLGGGLGIRYLSTQKPPTIEEFAEKLTAVLKREIKKYNLEPPRLMLEPGRSIVGEA